MCQGSRWQHAWRIHWEPEICNCHYNSLLPGIFSSQIHILYRFDICLKNDSIKMTREPQIGNKLSKSDVKCPLALTGDTGAPLTLTLGWTIVMKNYLNSVAQCITNLLACCLISFITLDSIKLSFSTTSLSMCSRKAYGVMEQRSHFNLDRMTNSISCKLGN